MLLTLLMLTGMLPVGTALAQDSITVYMTVSIKGEIAVAAGDVLMAQVPIEVTDVNSNGNFDMDDAFIALHDEYRTGGYASEGAGISLFWGEEKPACGYYKNNTSAMGVNETLADGDFVTAYTYEDTANWSDKFASFGSFALSVLTGGEISLSLTGYGWSSSEPISGAEIGLLSESGEFSTLDITTATDGTFAVSFDKPGVYMITAKAPAGVYMTAPAASISVLGEEDAKSVIDSDLAAISLGDEKLTSDIELPLIGQSGSTVITWESSESGVIT